jgi:hypothetical protein
MDLSTLARVKAATKHTGSTDDTLLALLLTEVSRLMERQMMRHAQRVERTEVFPLVSGYRTFSLPGVPIDLAQDVEMIASTTRDFTSGDAIPWERNTDYLLDETSGHVDVLSLPATKIIGVGLAPLAPAYIQVRYTGGLAVDTAGLIAAYPDIAGACDMQVAHRFRRMETLGSTTEKQAGSEATSTGEYDLLKAVDRVCAYYRRTVFA